MRRCLYCGKELDCNREKYCSRECMQKHWHMLNYVPKEKNAIKSNCLFCGIEIYSIKEKKYCSESCRGKYK